MNNRHSWGKNSQIQILITWNKNICIYLFTTFKWKLALSICHPHDRIHVDDGVPRSVGNVGWPRPRRAQHLLEQNTCWLIHGRSTFRRPLTKGGRNLFRNGVDLAHGRQHDQHHHQEDSRGLLHPCGGNDRDFYFKFLDFLTRNLWLSKFQLTENRKRVGQSLFAALLIFPKSGARMIPSTLPGVGFIPPRTRFSPKAENNGTIKSLEKSQRQVNSSIVPLLQTYATPGTYAIYLPMQTRPNDQICVAILTLYIQQFKLKFAVWCTIKFGLADLT